MKGQVSSLPLHGFESICNERQKVIVSRDSGQPRKHVANNVNENIVTHYKIDGIVITYGNKCDFLIINEDARKAYLIELKGSNLAKAALQLESTEEALKNELAGYYLEFRIVVSKARTHAIEGTSFKRFKEKKKQSLRYSTNKLEENI